MNKIVSKVIVIFWLCCFSFYIGNLVIGETKASFSSQVKTEPLTISAAFVFPRTIKQLEEKAMELEGGMNQHYQSILSTATGGSSIEELNRKLVEINAVKNELICQMNELQHIHDEMLTFNNQIQYQKSQQFDYVRGGFQHVEGVLKSAKASIDFQKVEAVRTKIGLQIRSNLEVKEDETSNFEKSE